MHGEIWIVPGDEFNPSAEITSQHESSTSSD